MTTLLIIYLIGSVLTLILNVFLLRNEMDKTMFTLILVLTLFSWIGLFYSIFFLCLTIAMDE